MKGGDPIWLTRLNGRLRRPVNVRPRTFMDEYEYNRAHIAENPEAVEDNIRTILTALA